MSEKPQTPVNKKTPPAQPIAASGQNNTPNLSSAVTDNIDRVRELIIGPDLKEHDRRFADLQRQIERIQNDLQGTQTNLRQAQEQSTDSQGKQLRRLDNLDVATTTALDELRQEFNRVYDLEKKSQQQSNILRQQDQSIKKNAASLKDLEQALTQQTRELRELKTAFGEHKEQIERRLDALKADLHQTEDNLLGEIRHLTDHLSDQKTDRKTLAAMFGEIATRLETGNTLTDLLDDLIPGEQK